MPDAAIQQSTQAGWEHFPHIADIGVHGFGATLNNAFEQAAMALTAIVTDPAAIDPDATIEICCEAPDPELLLADWLNAVIYEMVTRKMLFSRFTVDISGQVLQGSASGEKIHVEKHQPAAEPKGATLSELRVYKRVKDDSWHARCVVDV